VPAAERYLLDTSAVLALTDREDGFQKIEKLLELARGDRERLLPQFPFGAALFPPRRYRLPALRPSLGVKAGGAAERSEGSLDARGSRRRYALPARDTAAYRPPAHTTA
jgi:hypothetical protein